MSDYIRNDRFKEAVSIETRRIFDTCSERDFISDLSVTLDEGYTLTDSMNIVKTRCIDVTNACISVDPVPFKSGYYSVDITYTFKITMDAYESSCNDEYTPLSGTAVWNKRVILYGADGDIKTFTSDEPTAANETDTCCCKIINKPRVTINVVTPIALETKIDCRKIVSTCGEEGTYTRGIYVTIGLFSVISLSRPVSLLIPAYDYCVPGKECCKDAESPEDIFCRLEFPTEQFYPKSSLGNICSRENNVNEVLAEENTNNNDNDGFIAEG